MRGRPGIDFSEIPEASPAELRAMRRVGRPPLGVEARRLIAIRIDPQDGYGAPRMSASGIDNELLALAQVWRGAHSLLPFCSHNTRNRTKQAQERRTNRERETARCRRPFPHALKAVSRFKMLLTMIPS